jgi:hypothetical protein
VIRLKRLSLLIDSADLRSSIPTGTCHLLSVDAAATQSHEWALRVIVCVFRFLLLSTIDTVNGGSV